MSVKIEHVDVTPICPHCEAELPEIHAATHGKLTMHYVYVCPHCKKVLAIGTIYNL